MSLTASVGKSAQKHVAKPAPLWVPLVYAVPRELPALSPRVVLPQAAGPSGPKHCCSQPPTAACVPSCCLWPQPALLPLVQRVFMVRLLLAASHVRGRLWNPPPPASLRLLFLQEKAARVVVAVWAAGCIGNHRCPASADAAAGELGPAPLPAVPAVPAGHSLLSLLGEEQQAGFSPFPPLPRGCPQRLHSLYNINKQPRLLAGRWLIHCFQTVDRAVRIPLH